jgi:hypothetical protein
MYRSKDKELMMIKWDDEKSQIYIEECEVCKRKIKVCTQKDDQPECHTIVLVQCPCGVPVKFVLPVN